MRARRVGPPDVLLEPLVAEVGSAVEARLGEADVDEPLVLVEDVVGIPPRRPDAERELVPVRWVVGGRGGGDEPVDLGVTERPSGEVLGVDGDGGGLDHVVRRRRFGTGGDLVLGRPEVLDLELVAERVRLGPTRRVDERELDECAPGVAGLGDVDA